MKSEKRQIILLTTGAICCALAILFSVYYFLAVPSSHKTDKAAGPISPEKVVELVKSGEFVKRSPEEKASMAGSLIENRELLSQIMPSKDVPEEVKEAVRSEFRKIFQQREQKHAEEYCSLPEAEREAYLDQVIEEMEERMQRFSQQPPGGGERRNDGTQQRGRGQPNLPMIKERLENNTPVERAKRAEFRRALRARIEKREG